MTSHLTFFSTLFTVIALQFFQPSQVETLEVNIPMNVMAVSTADSLALVTLYNHTNGLNWKNQTNWLTTTPVSEWHGITVEEGRVRRVVLNNNNLTGIIPQEINSLTELRTLALDSNNVLAIESLEGLEKLQFLYVKANKLQSLPSVNQLKSLRDLYCQSNELSILPSLDSLKNLIGLGVSDNKLTSLPNLNNNKNLSFLYFSGNNIGFIPPLDSLVNLTRFDFANTGVSAFPAFPHPEKLIHIYCGNNFFSSLPDLSKFKNLEVLDCKNTDNTFSKLTSIPSLDSLKNLATLVLDNHELTELPSLDAMENLVYLLLSGNKLTSLPPLSKLTELAWLLLEGNNLEQLPDLSNQTQLTHLFVRKNRLTSVSQVKDLKRLRQLLIADQQHGYEITEIPYLGTLDSLRHLWCYSNELESLPGIENLVHLTYVQAQDNQLTEIPDLSNLNELWSIKLQGNSLTDFPNITSEALEYLDVSSNNISEIPDLIRFPNLKSLSIGGNNIDTLIGLEHLSELEFLSVLNNQLNELPPIHPLARLKTLRIDGNNFHDILNFDTDSLESLLCDNNHLDFGDLLPFKNILPDSQFTYIPQKEIDIEQAFLAVENEPLQLIGNAGGVNTSYIWYQSGNSNPISTADTLFFDQIQYTDSGSYYYEATNPNFPHLTLRSRLKHVEVRETSERALDSVALVALYHATNGNNWINNENWLTERPLNEWYGVRTEEIAGQLRVISIKLNSNKLVGEIPEEINHLDALKELSIGNITSDTNLLNRIRRIVSLDSLTNLTRLIITGNESPNPNDNIHSLPSLDNLINLRTLIIHDNWLSEIPSLDNLTQLDTLICHDNQLEFLPDLDHQPNFTYLWASNKNLKQLPSFKAPEKVKLIWLAIHSISGELDFSQFADLHTLVMRNPPLRPQQLISLKGLNNLTKLNKLDMFNVRLDSISSLDNLRSLVHLNLGHTEIRELPNLGNLESLRQLFINGNDSISEVPGIENLTALNWVKLDSNQFETLPLIVSTNLLKLSFSHNQIESIDEFGAFPLLEFLDASNNALMDISGLSDLDSDSLKEFRVDSNYLNFEQLAPIRDLDADTIIYIPQDSIGNRQEFIIPQNELFQFLPGAGGSNTSYKWYKVGNINPISTQDTLKFEQIQYADSGSYYYEATNMNFPGLTLRSRLKHVHVVEGEGLEADSLALVALYRRTNGDNWINQTNWLSEEPLHSWYGVTVSNGRVTSLDLRGNNLVGGIYESLGVLTELTLLYLYANKLERIVGLDKLTKLQFLDVYSNKLTELSDLRDLTQLQYFRCGTNQLTHLPDLNSPVLTQLHAFNNQLESVLSCNRFTPYEV